MKNYPNLVLIILVFIVLGCSCPKPEETKPAGTNNPASATPAPVLNKNGDTTVNETAAVTWKDYDKVYNIKSNSTDIQKDSLWKSFEGKTVTWNGVVDEVSEGMLGGLSIKIKMNPDTLTHDISLQLKDGQKEKAMQLTKGTKITFTGRLKSYGGTILPLMMDEGEFK